jgi:hypothetical protein
MFLDDNENQVQDTLRILECYDAKVINVFKSIMDDEGK